MIDAHQHFWQPKRGDYDWMPKGDPVLDRPYAPADLAPVLQAEGVEGTVLVQAAATVNETEYMLGLADATPFLKAVVGWVDFEKSSDRATLERLAQHPKFRGVRPMIQDIPDDDWMLRPEVQWGFEAVAGLGLTFDALGFPRHISNFLKLLKTHQDMRVVLDHFLKPQIRTPEGFASWADGMSRLAGETSAVIKYSALVTEANPGWTVEDLRPYVAHILKVFGPERMMWGSDWPVCRLRCEYEDWKRAAEALVAECSEAQKARIFGGTAREFYAL